MKHFLFAVFLVFASVAVAQERYMNWTDFADIYLDENSSDEVREHLENLYLHPLNINAANREELLRLPFLTDAQVDSILAYRERHHQFLTLGELQFISGLGFSDRCRLSLFVQAQPLPPRMASFKEKLFSGRHELETRLDLPLYQRKGEQDGSYLGNGLYNNLRYRYDWKRQMQYGLTLEKDAGEPFLRYHNVPYDAFSAYAHYIAPKNRYELLMGDYTLTIGQGLLFGNTSYGGKMALIDAPRRSSKVIHNHSSLSEAGFFRGSAGSISRGAWQLAAFISYRQLDSRQERDTVRSLISDGYHRTTRELSRRRNLENLTLGGLLTYSQPQWRIGLSGFYTHYDHILHPGHRDYARYFLRGQVAAGVSLHFYLHAHRFTLSGETAADRLLHLATTHTLVYSLLPSLQLTAQHRFFSPRFISPFGDALQEGSRVANEHGLLIGGKYNGLRRITLQAYVDLFRFPTSTFRAAGSSQGIEASLQTLLQLCHGHQLLLRFRTQTKQQNIPHHAGLLQYATTHRLRLQLLIRSNKWDLHPAFDASLTSKQTTANTLGWMLSLRTAFRPTATLRLATFAAMFFTDDYASACYAYEPYLRHSGGFGAFYYHGMRLALLGQLQLTTHWDVGLKYGLLSYFNKSTISTGAQLINASAKNDMSLQLRLRF